MRQILAFLILAVCVGCAQTTRNPSSVPTHITAAIQEPAPDLSLPGYAFDKMRYRSESGIYVGYTVVQKHGNLSVVYWENEFIPSMGFGHYLHIGDKVLATAQSIRGNYVETTNRIFDLRPLAPEVNTVIDGVSAQDLSFSFHANNANAGRTDLDRSYSQIAAGETVVEVPVNGTPMRFRAFRVKYRNSYEFYAVGHEDHTFVYIPALGARTNASWSSPQSKGSTSDYSFEVSPDSLKRLQTLAVH